MKIVRIITISTHIVVGLGALFGGCFCMKDPLCPLGAPPSLLEGSVFTSYFLPGLFLFTLLGLGSLFCAFFLYRFQTLGLLTSFLWGLLLALWIVIQCIIIKDVVAVHLIFFCIGLFQSAGASIALLRSGDAAYLLRELL
ncbi:MAG: hypothetical protein EOM15_12870 [Spirochaetia bacterium]|nr:hypothetical protein [Spirochaetia bacterium]